MAEIAPKSDELFAWFFWEPSFNQFETPRGHHKTDIVGELYPIANKIHLYTIQIKLTPKKHIPWRSC